MENSTIIFTTLQELAEFTAAYAKTGATHMFDTRQISNGNWELTFNGGY